jgi:hypothetical protein
MGISAKEAAQLVGMSKAGILKSIKSGKVSAQKDLNGEWRIEPVELFRVYTPVSTNGHTPVATSPQPSIQVSTDGLQREVDLLREMIQRQDEVISNLWDRLEAEIEERRKLTLLLTDTGNKAVDNSPQLSPRSRSWWARLLGG